MVEAVLLHALRSSNPAMSAVRLLDQEHLGAVNGLPVHADWRVAGRPLTLTAENETWEFVRSSGLQRTDDVLDDHVGTGRGNHTRTTVVPRSFERLALSSGFGYHTKRGLVGLPKWLPPAHARHQLGRRYEAMTESNRTYLPAAGRHWRLPFYDVLARLLGADRGRKVLLGQMSCEAGAHILEVGCGTGEMLLLLKRAHPEAHVVGLDPDPSALELAERKLRRAGVSVRLDQGFAEGLPYGDQAFDVVVSSLMFHHLAPAAKSQALEEVVRVLEPGGRFDMLDLAEPPSSNGHGFLSRRIHLIHHLKDNDERQVLRMMNEAGLSEPCVVGRLAQRFSRMVCYRAYAPSGAGTVPDQHGGGRN